MGFYYSGNIEKLKTFYLFMRKINVQIGTFEYTYIRRLHSWRVESLLFCIV